MSRMMSRLHFLPSTPKLVAIGQFLNGTTGTGGSTGMLAMAIACIRWRGWDSAFLKADGGTSDGIEPRNAITSSHSFGWRDAPNP